MHKSSSPIISIILLDIPEPSSSSNISKSISNKEDSNSRLVKCQTEEGVIQSNISNTEISLEENVDENKFVDERENDSLQDHNDENICGDNEEDTPAVPVEVRKTTENLMEDPAVWPLLNNTTTELIILKGPVHIQDINLPRCDTSNQYFSSVHYNRSMCNGEKIVRDWLIFQIDN